MKYKTILSGCLLAFFIAFMMLFSIACQSNGDETVVENHTREIAKQGAGALLDIGFAAIIAKNPELATEMRLARQGITYLTNEETTTVDVNTLTTDLQSALLEQVSDPVIAEVLMSDFADGIVAVAPPDDVPASGSRYKYSASERSSLLAAFRRK